MRCNLDNEITLDALVERLNSFKLDTFDNLSPNPNNIESTFKDKLKLKEKTN